MYRPRTGQCKEEFIDFFLNSEDMKEKYPDDADRLAAAYFDWYQHVNMPVYKEEAAEVSLDFNITKSTDQGLVSGWANIAVQADGSLPLDWQDDVILPADLEKAAVSFMLEYRSSGVMHEGDSMGIVVESIVFTKEKQAAIGIPEGCVPEGWFITVKVLNTEVFKQVKEGKYKMFSIQGKAKRIKQ